jgi:uncharacterized protein (UPF0210 family)
VRALTVGIPSPHPLTGAALQSAASDLRRASAAFTRAGWEVQTERISTRPLLSDLRDWPDDAVVAYGRELQEALDGLGVPFCSVGPALAADGPDRAELMADVVAGNPAVNAAVMVATPDGGLDVAMARAAGNVMARLAKGTDQGLGNFNFAALACVAPGGPFLPAAYHDPGGPANLAVALQGASVVGGALSGGADLEEVAGRVARQVCAVAGPAVQLAAQQSELLGLEFAGIDLSPAPDGEDSIVAAIEQAGHGPFGGPGTLALAAALTAGVQATGLPSCGYCGLMLPLMEDVVLARRWEEGWFNLDQLLGYSAVCGTGLDTVPLPGSTSPEQLAKVICDVGSLSLRQRKPLSARLLPVPGRGAGERTQFSSPYLVDTVIKPLGPVS